jgi:nucleotide-binding universal stress UspA family protein
MGPVIVPLDESALAEEAVGWAAAIARAQGRPMHLVSVQPPADAFWEVADVDPRVPIQAHRETLQGYLDQLRRLDVLKGLPVSVEVLDGRVVPQLRWLVDRTEAALVVITTRGRSGFRPGSIGSVADKLVRTLAVPVVVVPPGAPFIPIDAILVPLDGSDQSAHALQPARELARGLGATVHLLRVIDPDIAWGLPEEEGARFLAEVRKQANDYLASVAAAGEVTAVCDGRPPEAILDYAGESGCRLIAMATHGRSEQLRLELGSVADAIMRVTDRPVMLVTSPPAA